MAFITTIGLPITPGDAIIGTGDVDGTGGEDAEGMAAATAAVTIIKKGDL